MAGGGSGREKGEGGQRGGGSWRVLGTGFGLNSGGRRRTIEGRRSGVAS